MSAEKPDGRGERMQDMVFTAESILVAAVKEHAEDPGDPAKVAQRAFADGILVGMGCALNGDDGSEALRFYEEFAGVMARGGWRAGE